MGILRDLGRGSVVSGRPWPLYSSHWYAHRFCETLAEPHSLAKGPS